MTTKIRDYASNITIDGDKSMLMYTTSRNVLVGVPLEDITILHDNDVTILYDRTVDTSFVVGVSNEEL